MLTISRHLHGHHFQILSKMPEVWFDVQPQFLYDWVTTTGRSGAGTNPARRDTLFIEKNVTYVIAFKPDNPGVWAFHCHNDIHAISGMFSQVIERPKALRSMLGTWMASPTPTLWWPSFALGQSGTNSAMRDKVQEIMFMALQAYGWTSAKMKRSRIWRGLA
jgi:hypothetical protein